MLYVDQFEASTRPPPLGHLKFCRLVCSNSRPQTGATDLMVNVFIPRRRLDTSHAIQTRLKFLTPGQGWQSNYLMLGEGDVEARIDQLLTVNTAPLAEQKPLYKG